MKDAACPISTKGGGGGGAGAQEDGRALRSGAAPRGEAGACAAVRSEARAGAHRTAPFGPQRALLAALAYGVGSPLLHACVRGVFAGGRAALPPAAPWQPDPQRAASHAWSTDVNPDGMEAGLHN